MFAFIGREPDKAVPVLTWTASAYLRTSTGGKAL